MCEFRLGRGGALPPPAFDSATDVDVTVPLGVEAAVAVATGEGATLAVEVGWATSDSDSLVAVTADGVISVVTAVAVAGVGGALAVASVGRRALVLATPKFMSTSMFTSGAVTTAGGCAGAAAAGAGVGFRPLASVQPKLMSMSMLTSDTLTAAAAGAAVGAVGGWGCAFLDVKRAIKVANPEGGSGGGTGTAVRGIAAPASAGPFFFFRSVTAAEGESACGAGERACGGWRGNEGVGRDARVLRGGVVAVMSISGRSRSPAPAPAGCFAVANRIPPLVPPPLGETTAALLTPRSFVGEDADAAGVAAAFNSAWGVTGFLPTVVSRDNWAPISRGTVAWGAS